MSEMHKVILRYWFVILGGVLISIWIVLRGNTKQVMLTDFTKPYVDSTFYEELGTKSGLFSTFLKVKVRGFASDTIYVNNGGMVPSLRLIGNIDTSHAFIQYGDEAKLVVLSKNGMPQGKIKIRYWFSGL